MSEKHYSVTGPMAIVNLDNGSAVHLQRGAAVPSNVKPDHLQHLIDQDLVSEVEVVGGLEPVYSGDLAKKVTFASQEEAKAAARDERAAARGVDEAEQAPAKSASKAEWVDFAVAQGADRDEAEASTKDDLVATYGGE